ncbi:MAG: hypothetical protein AAF974_06675 [Cyanobacteria bacterium P01_E01_bin.34]
MRDLLLLALVMTALIFGQRLIEDTDVQAPASQGQQSFLLTTLQ